jgi:hypothetical protein
MERNILKSLVQHGSYLPMRVSIHSAQHMQYQPREAIARSIFSSVLYWLSA